MIKKNKKPLEESIKINKIDPKKIFNINCDFPVHQFVEKTELVPEIDEDYIFDQAHVVGRDRTITNFNSPV